MRLRISKVKHKFHVDQDVLLALVIIGLFIGITGWALPTIIFPNCSNNIPSELQCSPSPITTTITAGSTGVSQTITFPFAWTSAPKYISVSPLTITGGGSVTFRSSVSMLNLAPIPQLQQAVLPPTLDVSALTGDANFNTDPFSFTIGVTPTQLNEWAVLIIGNGDNTGICCYATVSSVTDNQGGSWQRVEAIVSGVFVLHEGELWASKLTTTNAYTITINMGGQGGGNNVLAGAAIALYQNVEGIRNHASSNAGGVTGADSVTFNTIRDNDIVVGGSVIFSELTTGACEFITPGGAQVQQQNDNVNCAANLYINFDLEDIVIPTAGSYVFSATYSNAPDDVIMAVGLMGFSTIPSWDLSTSFTELFQSTGNEQTFVGNNGNTIVLNFICTMFSGEIGSPLPTITLRLVAGSTTTSTLSGNPNFLCDGTTHLGSTFTISTASLSGPWKLQGACTANCPTTPITLEFTNISFLYSYVIVLVPSWRITTITTTTFTIVWTETSNVPATSTITWSWRAQN